MRLWHYKLISYLPKSQLIAQWRELNSIFKKQDKHILINYVYEYNHMHLELYSKLVLNEMDKRGYKYNLLNYMKYFVYKKFIGPIDIELTGNKGILDYSYPNIPFPNHHDNRYLLQCFYNLQEKYDRGQKDFSKEQYERLEEFIKNEIY